MNFVAGIAVMNVVNNHSRAVLHQLYSTTKLDPACLEFSLHDGPGIKD
jgi:hypothetical protein